MSQSVTDTEKELLEATLNHIFDKIEDYLHDFRLEAERLILPEYKCAPKVSQECYRASYDACLSELPSPQCPGGESSKACGDGKKCGTTYDFNNSVLRLGPDSFNPLPGELYGEPTDEAKEAVCNSLQLEPYMKNIFELYRPQWGQWNLNPPPLFYGSISGAFRIYPGKPFHCSDTFDPRRRPWYIAVTGAKSIVIILDTGGSMGRNDVINDFKKIITLQIKSLSSSDYVSLITCSDVEQLRSTSKFKAATDDFKKELLDQLNNITVGGESNFELCFNEAFGVMQQNDEILSAGSQIAIMFFTDGAKTIFESSKEDSLINSIKEKVQNYKSNNMESPVFFTFSYPDSDSKLAKTIACETNGVWSGIDVKHEWDTLKPYYNYLSLGLSDPQKKDYVTWVEPYKFLSGQGRGPSVSAPVYDRSVYPPVLAGVVAMLITMDDLKRATGVQNEDLILKLIQDRVHQSVPKNSKIQLNHCQMESLRYREKYNATCSDSCPNITIFGVKKCTNVTYPEKTLNNKNLSYKAYTYEERACCHVNRSVIMGSSDFCIDPSSTPENATNHEKSSNPTSSAIATILGGVLGSLLVVIVMIGVRFFLYKKKRHLNEKKSGDPLRALPGSISKNENSFASSNSNVEEGIKTSETKEEKLLPSINETSMEAAIADRDDGGLNMASNSSPQKRSASGESFTLSTLNCEESYCGSSISRMKHNRTSSVGSIETDNEEETTLVRAYELFTKAKDADKACEWEDAMKSYRSASKHFMQGLKYERTDERKHYILELIITCMERSELLECLIKDESDVSGGIGSASANECSADNDNDEKKILRKSLESSIVEKKPNVKWDDIAGLTAAKTALQQAIIVPKVFPQYKAKLLQKILLYGPPGTGKTHLARAVATEVDSPFISISSADVLSKWQGDSEKRVKEIFEMAREGKGVIFIDEIDALCSSRTGGESESSRRIKTEFLTQMDGVIVHSSDALLIAATNIPWELDEAIRRRFDKRIYIPLPDLEARTYMLKLRIRDIPNDLTDEQLKALGRNTDGASGSDIDALVKDAHLESFNKYFKAKQFLPVENGNYYEPCEFYPNCRFCPPKLSTDPPDKDNTCEKCGAKRMRLMAVPSDKLKPPTLTWKYFERALEKRSYTAASAQELERFSNWTRTYGECGTL